MNKYIIVVLILSIQVNAQLAIINDADGYTNVRSEKKLSSSICGRLFNDDVFLYYQDDYETSDWVNVCYNVDLDKIEPFKKDYYINNLHCKTNDLYITGYIHKSRLLPLERVENVKIPNLNKARNELNYSNDTLTFAFRIGGFRKSGHRIEKRPGDQIKIDGLYPHGTDDIPMTEIQNMTLSVNKNHIEIPKEEFRDLFEPNLEKLKILIDKRGVVYIFMPENSDAGCAYDAVWIIKDGKYLKRYVDGWP